LRLMTNQRHNAPEKLLKADLTPVGADAAEEE